MKKVIALTLVLLLALSVVACNDPPPVPTPEPSADPTPAAPATITIKFSNDTNYNFNRIYISPTASNEWGNELLGDTSILKSHGSFDVRLQAYDFDNYDIKVIDEDNDEYIFTRVSLNDGYEVSIYFGSVLSADIFDRSGNEVGSVIGTLNGNEVGAGSDYDDDDYYEPYIEQDVEYSFTVYNESAYEIVYIYLGTMSAVGFDDIDILPVRLAANSNIHLSGTIPAEFSGITDWSLYVIDADGDTSAFHDHFNLWTVSYVDIGWSGVLSGYESTFYY